LQELARRRRPLSGLFISGLGATSSVLIRELGGRSIAETGLPARSTGRLAPRRERVGANRFEKIEGGVARNRMVDDLVALFGASGERAKPLGRRNQEGPLPSDRASDERRAICPAKRAGGQDSVRPARSWIEQSAAKRAGQDNYRRNDLPPDRNNPYEQTSAVLPP
jgi:hypothetical protein